jgi:hypothetical protein
MYYPEHTSLATDSYYKQALSRSKGRKRYEDISRNTSNVPIEHVVNVTNKLSNTIDHFYSKKSSLDSTRISRT